MIQALVIVFKSLSTLSQCMHFITNRRCQVFHLKTCLGDVHPHKLWHLGGSKYCICIEKIGR